MSPTLGPIRVPNVPGAPVVAVEPAHRLGDHVEGRPVGVGALTGPRVAEAADRAVHEPWVDLRQRLVAEAELVEHADAEVLDDHVGVADEVAQRVTVGLLSGGRARCCASSG